MLFPCEIRRSSSPTSSGRIVRCEAKYGGMKQPSSATIPSRSGKVRRSSPCSSGIDARIGARAKSEISIVFRAPMRSTRIPLGMPSTTIGAISAARTSVIFPGDPVVTRTNHGSARYVMRVPKTEMTSARTSAETAVFFTEVVVASAPSMARVI